MIEWLHVTLVAVSAGFLVVAILLIIKKCFCSKTRQNLSVSDAERGLNLQNGISRLHQVSPHHNLENHLHRDDSKKTNHNLFRSTKSPVIFSWADNPSLVTEAVENGWSRFAFTIFMSSSPSLKSSRARLGPCVGSNDPGNENRVEIGWEICEGSADFMQKIRLNPEIKISKNNYVNLSTGAVSCVIRTGLPLPGPHLGTSSFPQEAYYEITILSFDDNAYEQNVDRDNKKDKSEGEKIKLINEDFKMKNSKNSSSHLMSKIEEMKIGKNKNVYVSVGLTGGGPVQLKIPGSYPGSIGFNSTGSVYLDGTKIVFDSEKDEWGRTDKVIGCGYNPSLKKVFFTVDSLLVHEIYCQTEEFGTPLYPIIAANSNTIVLVNFGQSPFKYIPANLQRTCNPCFIANSPALGYDDSKELFSMGRIDAQWMQTRSNNNTVNSIKALEYDQESEGDLFEIVLDSTGRSPSPYSTTYNQ